MSSLKEKLEAEERVLETELEAVKKDKKRAAKKEAAEKPKKK